MKTGHYFSTKMKPSSSPLVNHLLLVLMFTFLIGLSCISKTLIDAISGYTSRLTVVLQFSSSSMLMVSWIGKDETVSRTTLYQSELDSYTNLSMDATTNNHYSFTALEPCSSYVACVEIAGTQSLTCLAAATG